jgi:hypothetical protein
VCVDAQRDVRLRVAKALADSDDIDIRIDQLAGVRMPKLLAAKSLQAALMALRESGAPSRLANKGTQ